MDKEKIERGWGGHALVNVRLRESSREGVQVKRQKERIG